ncbi:GrpB family protein [Ornithinibacillus xuwenensis]|uniref:GrpB family protein n=1 Tax=Ornithinibacillus xuwenensis TaxID=3144668 RepID=A0ABU9XHR4_9BACI
MRSVSVVPYRKEWPSLFQSEVAELKKIFGLEVDHIYHIGSTAVPGLAAKPIIDIMPVVHDINRIDDFHDAMIGIGYEPRGENGIPGRRYFQKGGNNRTHHVHVYEQGSQEIKRHLAFRDYLRTHRSAVKRYGELKKELAKQHPFDMDSYIRGKHNVVLEIESEAIKWYETIGEEFHD